MILTGLEILKEIKAGNIIISDFNESRLNPNSYNVRLDNKLLIHDRSEGDSLDIRREPKVKEIIIPEEGYMLHPGTLYLGSTVEYTESHKHFPCLSGRSSIGRRGINIHVTAGFGDIGYCGNWTLEIFVIESIKIFPYIPIGQIYYFEAKGDVVPYNGRYQNSHEVNPSRFYLDYQDK